MTKHIQIDGDVIAWLRTKQQPDEPLGETVRRELGISVVDIDDETYAYLLTRATSIGESASEILRRELDIGEGPPDDHAGPNVVEFRIPDGTGSGPWNTRPEECARESRGHPSHRQRRLGVAPASHRPRPRSVPTRGPRHPAGRRSGVPAPGRVRRQRAALRP